MASMKIFITSLLLVTFSSIISLEARNPFANNHSIKFAKTNITTFAYNANVASKQCSSISYHSFSSQAHNATMNPTLPSLNLPPLSSTSLPNLPTISTIISSIPFNLFPLRSFSLVLILLSMLRHCIVYLLWMIVSLYYGVKNIFVFFYFYLELKHYCLYFLLYYI